MENNNRLLPKRAEIMARALLVKPLFTTSQLRAGTGLSEDQAKRGIQDLEEKEFIASAGFGALLPGVRHHWLTEEGLDYFGATNAQRSWHGPHGIGNFLIYDMFRVEAVNDLAVLLATRDWKLSAIQWFEGEPMVAVAAYSHPDHKWPAYQLFCMASMMENHRELFNRLQQLQHSIDGYSLNPDQKFCPAGLSIVSDNEWGAANALGMAQALLSSWVPGANITGWYHGGDSWYASDGWSAETGTAPTQITPLGTPIDPLRVAPSVRKLGRRHFDRIVNRCRWTGAAGPGLFFVLTLLGQYPIISVSHLTALAGEGRTGEETEKRLVKLVDMGLAELVASNVRATGRGLTISRRGQGASRYAATHNGRLALCYAFGGTPGALHSRSGLSSLYAEKGGWSFRHGDGVYEILAQYRENGCAVAPGWRAHATLANSPNGQQIQPDGMVLRNTPWGKLWCKLEFELSDRSVKAFKPRCEKYASEDRRDSNPLLIACRDDRAEINFHRAVAEYAPELRVITSTVRRLREGGVFGENAWEYQG